MQSILLVEDSRILQRQGQMLLAKAGYRVVTAGDGEEALRLAESLVPDLILLDILLPKLGGTEVIQALRQNPATSAIPIVVLSSLPESNAAKLIHQGAAAYCQKAKLASDQGSLLEVVRKTLAGAPRTGLKSEREGEFLR